MPAILPHWRLSQENHKFKAKVDYIGRLCLKTIKKICKRILIWSPECCLYALDYILYPATYRHAIYHFNFKGSKSGITIVSFCPLSFITHCKGLLILCLLLRQTRTPNIITLNRSASFRSHILHCCTMISHYKFAWY
jgi:hypothetical protein